MSRDLYAILVLLVMVSCTNQKGKSQLVEDAEAPIICDSCSIISTRFNPPDGYERVKVPEASFAFYLQNLPLKPMGSKVYYFDGNLKLNKDVYVSVVAMDIDAQDLQQCADAVIRLKGEYHYQRKEYNKIHFNFLSDGKPRYFQNYASGDYSYKKFRKYMRYVFSYANTASLYHEMIKVPIDSMQIGDVFIQKRNPYGHAVIVVDMVINKTTGKKLFMLAQSYMPAQETQILINPAIPAISPWYRLKHGNIVTPEWNFTSDDLRRFKE